MVFLKQFGSLTFTKNSTNELASLKALMVCPQICLLCFCTTTLSASNTTGHTSKINSIENNRPLFSCEILPNSTPSHFIHESVDGKYSLYKYAFDGLDVILRNDRIEFFTSSNGVEHSSFLIYSNSKNAALSGMEQLATETVAIPNPAMARVLGSETMNVTTYKSVRYSNVYENTDLLVSIENDALKFTFVANSANGVPNVDLALWGNSALSKSASSAQLKVADKLIEFKSDNNQSIKDGKISISNRQKSGELSFFLIAK